MVLGGLLHRPTCVHRLARVGQFRDSLDDYIPLTATYTFNLLARRFRSEASSSKGLAGVDIEGSLQLVPEPDCRGRAKVPCGTRRNECPSGATPAVVHDAERVSQSQPLR